MSLIIIFIAIFFICLLGYKLGLKLDEIEEKGKKPQYKKEPIIDIDNFREIK